jgi:hypothetical protein
LKEGIREVTCKSLRETSRAKQKTREIAGESSSEISVERKVKGGFPTSSRSEQSSRQFAKPLEGGDNMGTRAEEILPINHRAKSPGLKMNLGGLAANHGAKLPGSDEKPARSPANLRVKFGLGGEPREDHQ